MSMYPRYHSVDILVNGNTCKQYNHHGKIYLEAKDGSEYEIKITNNFGGRILAISSVDSLNVLTGEPASDQDTGYVINGYDSLRIKGFRYSDEKVGAFKFSAKSKSYASSKGESHNVGVIGIKLFNEMFVTKITRSTTTPMWNFQDMTYTCNSVNDSYVSYDSTIQSYLGNSVINASCNIPTKGFDMGTQWGQVKESKVTETEFNKGLLAFSVDIYYASRESLIEMDIPLTNTTKVAFPESFPKKYATPPKGWMV